MARQRDETTVSVNGRQVRVSSPSRVVFPDQGWTKLDVVEHFLRCGEGALRGVRDRPCLLKRWPKGVGAAPFFQKRAAAKYTGEVVRVTFPAAHPGDMIVARDVADIIGMVQVGCLDLNPWPARKQDVDHPDELRVDLDPTEGTSFDDVRRAAGLIRELLEEHGLVGWPKTSGSRGIHVYARVEPRWSYHELRRACLALARQAERREPGLVTTAWWKEERRGVFVDFNQNARDKTLASAYSVRHTGLVSAPFAWEELDEIQPTELTLARFPERWETAGDPSRGIDDTLGSLESLLALVEEDEQERGLGDAPWPPHYPKQPGEPPRVPPSRRRSEVDD